MSLVLHGFTCPECRCFNGSEKGWRPSCRSCGCAEPAHCAVCRAVPVVAICDEHGPRCATHVATHAYCGKLKEAVSMSGDFSIGSYVWLAMARNSGWDPRS
jgi:hypothetical protein